MTAGKDFRTWVIQEFGTPENPTGGAYNPVIVKEAIQTRPWNLDDLQYSYRVFEANFLQFLRYNFAADAFRYIQAMNMVTSEMAPVVEEVVPRPLESIISLYEQYDDQKDQLSRDFMFELSKIRTGGLDVGMVRKYFQRYFSRNPKGHPYEEEILQESLDFMYENFVAGNQSNTPTYSDRAVQMAKVVNYLIWSSVITAAWTCDAIFSETQDYSVVALNRNLF